MSANRAARALGISDATMRIWIRAAKPAATLRPVVVTTAEPELLRGDLYLFTGKDRRRAKVILCDGTGVSIYMKRMSRGHFVKLRDVWGELRTTLSELALYLEGSELVAPETLSPPALRLKDLARFDCA